MSELDFLTLFQLPLMMGFFIVAFHGLLRPGPIRWACGVPYMNMRIMVLGKEDLAKLDPDQLSRLRWALTGRCLLAALASLAVGLLLRGLWFVAFMIQLPLALGILFSIHPLTKALKEDITYD